MKTHLTLKSENEKTGPIPVSTSSAKTCPSTCPLKSACYAKYVPLVWHWKRVTQGTRGDTWKSFLSSIASLSNGQVWRHNQAGDLAGLNTKIDGLKLAQLVHANKGKRGYTYTHKPVLNHANAKQNRELIRRANTEGFTINLSANNIAEADSYKALGIAPVVTVLPQDAPKTQLTLTGNKVIVCPAQYKDNVTCANCRLCAIRDRKVIIGFLAHGTAGRRAETIARG